MGLRGEGIDKSRVEALRQWGGNTLCTASAAPLPLFQPPLKALWAQWDGRQVGAANQGSSQVSDPPLTQRDLSPSSLPSMPPALPHPAWKPVTACRGAGAWQWDVCFESLFLINSSELMRACDWHVVAWGWIQAILGFWFLAIESSM